MRKAHRSDPSVIVLPFVEEISGAEGAAEDPAAAHELVLFTDVLVTDRALVEVGVVLPGRALLALLHEASPVARGIIGHAFEEGPDRRGDPGFA